MTRVKILNNVQIKQKINRLAYEVYEKNFGEKNLLIIGIEGNGYKVAERLAEKLKEISPIKIQIEKIKIDKDKPWESDSKIDFDPKAFVNKTTIIVDDVLNSGKTLIYAVKLFLDKPVKKISTVVLVDRSHNRFPVKADFVGLTLSTTLQEHIETDFSKKGTESVFLI